MYTAESEGYVVTYQVMDQDGDGELPEGLSYDDVDLLATSDDFRYAGNVARMRVASGSVVSGYPDAESVYL